MSKLPNLVSTIETLKLKEDAKPWVHDFIQRNNELEEIFEVLQPLLLKLSILLYGKDAIEVKLDVLVSKSVEYLDKEIEKNE